MNRCKICGQFIKAGEALCPRDKPRRYEPTSRTSNVSYELAAYDTAAATLEKMKPKTHRRPRIWFRRSR